MTTTQPMTLERAIEIMDHEDITCAKGPSDRYEAWDVVKAHIAAQEVVEMDAERYRFLKSHGILSGSNPDAWIDTNIAIAKTRGEG